MSHSYLITGGSAGIGLGLALAALKAGHRVVAATRNSQRAAGEHPELEKLGGKWLKLDVTDANTTEIVRKTTEEHDIDVLVNCAGYALIGAVEDVSDEEMHAQYNANVYGPVRTIRGVLPTFRAKKGGTIVNVSSGAAFGGRASRGFYAATKWALEGMSESLAAELEPFNIRVVIVDPGAFKTGFGASIATPAKGIPGKGVTEPYLDGPIEKAIALTTKIAEMPGIGDPSKAGQVILEFVEKTGRCASEAVHGKRRLILGTDSLEAARNKVRTLGENVEAMTEVAPATRVDD